MLYRDNRQFPGPFTENSVPLSRLDGLAGGFLHLQGDVGKVFPPFMWSLLEPFMLLIVTEDEVALTAPSSVFPTPTKSLSVSRAVAPMLSATPGEPSISTSENDNGSTDRRSPTNTNRDNAGIAGWEIALIATFTTLVFLLALIIVGLVLGILVYRRWKVEQMKKTLLEIRPAHLAIGSYIL